MTRDEQRSADQDLARPSVVRPDFGGAFPEHIAVIMDGNGRWAQGRGMRRIFGHREGIRSVREITTECARMGVRSLTLYAFSVENWKRPSLEVRYLMRLLRKFLIQERPTLLRNGVRLRGIGRLETLPDDARQALAETERLTAGGDGMLLRLALAYGSRSELADALRKAAIEVQSGRLSPDAIDEDSMRRFLYDPETPDSARDCDDEVILQNRSLRRFTVCHRNLPVRPQSAVIARVLLPNVRAA
jgi:undecaprenyl diphosphate synthase